jgi:isoleucyl-tRNA synthetase|tara:strand:- start:314 stop:1279 length:966 start_codon:yes stop_codon:yes gene_type:complete
MTRKEIWDDSHETLNRRLAIYATLGHILKILDILLHPISPYITEHLYQQSFREKKSILLEKWPIVEKRFCRPELEEDVQQVLQIISLMNSARMKAKLKRRWPLKLAQIIFEDKERMERYLDLIKDQGNIKDVLVTPDLKDTPIGVKITPRYDLLGSKLKTRMQSFVKYLAAADSLRIFAELKDKGKISVKLEGDKTKILKNELTIEYIAIDDNYIVVEKEGIIVALKKERDADLISDGNVRDLARRLQALRKERGYNPTEILGTAYISGLDSLWQKSINSKLNELTYLVRVKKTKMMDKPIEGVHWVDAEIDGNPIKISIE